jgi:hypothetical protein
MVRGIERGRIVDLEKDRIDFVRQMGETAKKMGTTSYTWSLLSNHAHIFLQSGSFRVLVQEYFFAFISGAGVE